MSGDTKELAKQMDMALEAFVQTFADAHFFTDTPVQYAARQIRKMREDEAINRAAQRQVDRNGS